MKYTSTLLAISAALFSQGVVAGLYSKNDAVIDLTPKNFDKEVLNSDHLVFVEFYAPWCGHCKNLVPTFRKAAKNLEGIVKFGAVDCDNDTNRPICSRYGIQGFPTLKAFPGVSRAYLKKHTVGKKTPIDYNGARAGGAIVNFLTSQLPDNVRSVSKRPSSERNTNIDDLIADENNVRALLLTDRDQASAMYKGLATEFAHKLHVAAYSHPDMATLTKLGVESMPALVVFNKGSQEPVKYTGPLKREALAEHFASLLSDETSESNDGSSSSSSDSTPTEPFDPKVHQAKTQADLQRECLDKATGTCVLAFMVVEEEFPESVEQHAENLAILERVKAAVHEKEKQGTRAPVHFVWLDALKKDVQQLRDRFQLSTDVPGLMLVHPKRKAFMPFVGAFDFDGVMEWLQEAGSQRAHAYAYTHELALEEEVKKKDGGMKDQGAGSNSLPKDEL
ncbi:protein disulfide isomerase (PDI) protein [Actinomortierella ambigua]|nr:protein disulfide isomerase (PDI) protein [Actinomortierella ambigua]